jgi:hypothetical protein
MGNSRKGKAMTGKARICCTSLFLDRKLLLSFGLLRE